MIDSVPPEPKTLAPGRARAASWARERVKFFSAKILRNPLISHDFGRENPRKSKLFQPLNLGIPKRKSRESRNPKSRGRERDRRSKDSHGQAASHDRPRREAGAKQKQAPEEHPPEGLLAEAAAQSAAGRQAKQRGRKRRG